MRIWGLWGLRGYGQKVQKVDEVHEGPVWYLFKTYEMDLIAYAILWLLLVKHITQLHEWMVWSDQGYICEEPTWPLECADQLD